MFKRTQLAAVSLVLGLCIPAFAQEGTARSVSSVPSATNAHAYHHLDTAEEDELLDAGPAETEAKTVEFLQTHEPEVYREIERVKLSDPAEYAHMITMESHHVKNLEDLQIDDAEGFRLALVQLRAHDRVGALAEACRENNHPDKNALRAAVDQLFEARQAAERHQLELSRKDLDEQAKELQSRDSKRASIVDNYVHSITVSDSERW